VVSLQIYILQVPALNVDKVTSYLEVLTDFLTNSSTQVITPSFQTLTSSTSFEFCS